MLSIELSKLQRSEIDIMETADVDRPSAGIEARANEGVDSAMPAEVVLCRLRVELIKLELALAFDYAELLLRCAVPQRAPESAQRAVAVDDVSQIRLKLEGNATAVA